MDWKPQVNNKFFYPLRHNTSHQECKQHAKRTFFFFLSLDLILKSWREVNASLKQSVFWLGQGKHLNPCKLDADPISFLMGHSSLVTAFLPGVVFSYSFQNTFPGLSQAASAEWFCCSQLGERGSWGADLASSNKDSWFQECKPFSR